MTDLAVSGQPCQPTGFRPASRSGSRNMAVLLSTREPISRTASSTQSRPSRDCQHGPMVDGMTWCRCSTCLPWRRTGPRPGTILFPAFTVDRWSTWTMPMSGPGMRDRFLNFLARQRSGAMEGTTPAAIGLTDGRRTSPCPRSFVSCAGNPGLRRWM